MVWSGSYFMFMGLINERIELVEVFYSVWCCYLCNWYYFNMVFFILYILISEYVVGCIKVDIYIVFGGMNWYFYYSFIFVGVRIEVL